MKSGEQALLATGLEHFRPGDPGYRAARHRRIRGAAAGCARPTTRVPVLVLTARDQLEDRVHGLDVGADDYMVKPFATPELVSARVPPRAGRQARTGPEDHPRAAHARHRGARRDLGRPSRSTSPAREWAVLEVLLARVERIPRRKNRSSSRLASWGEELPPTRSRSTSRGCAPSWSPPESGSETVRGFGYMLEGTARTRRRQELHRKGAKDAR